MTSETDPRAFKRRAFLASIALGACETGRQASSPRQSAAPTTPEVEPIASSPASARDNQPTVEAGSVPRRTLGLTGDKVSAIGLGGYHLGIPTEPDAIRIMHRAIDEGMTFFDNCWDYHGGE